MSIPTLTFATSNLHKLEEIRLILPNHQILGLKDIGIDVDIEETGDTLEENALIKAQFLYNQVRNIALSEDTGLEVFALNGAPGVHTARYAGDDRDPVKNMEKLLHSLNGIDNRNAQFRTIIAMVDESGVRYFEGIVKGTIAFEISGTEGFGYDPIFIPEGYNETFAQLSSDIKRNISHRARAVSALVKFLT